jgi:hypothetical protein
MAVTRPLKEGSVTTYQAKVAAGFPDILASEMDADLDTIYAAWNGGVGTANLVDGSVTTPKLATAPNGVATANLNDLAVTTAKLAAGAVSAAKIGITGSVRAFQFVAVRPSLAITTTPTDMAILPSITTSGGYVLLIAWLGAWLNPGAQAQVGMFFTWQRDGGNIAGATVNTAGGGTPVQPLPPHIYVDQPAAGAHIYKLQGNTNLAAASIMTPASNTGIAWAIELA